MKTSRRPRRVPRRSFVAASSQSPRDGHGRFRARVGVPMEPSLYVNRELSWLEFDQRVLEEALDPTVPLLERVKFLAIVSSNLDEFFMVRVAGLKRLIGADSPIAGPDGLSPGETLAAVSHRAH